ncbi:nucleotidyl transferase AbiEii/AbiGii toxin family protein [Streptomyces sp. NPDC026206]|uniref:nucleotidyl transferase AbiEii/AbiGii toxin family protein n=1 Tax=Streptomyces sp. NPDC026206 TaxID=3157089 RepID=UPI00340A47FC
MRLTGLQRRLLADLVAVGAPYPLVLTGGVAVQVHGLVTRPVGDLALATDSPVPMADIASALRAGLQARGLRVRQMDTDPLSARFFAEEPETGQECEVHLLKETMWRPPVPTEYGLVLAAEDVAGTKTRALADRGLARDLVDVHAAAGRWSRAELEEFGRRHARDAFDLADLRARLEGADWIDDREFAAYGLDPERTGELRRWAQAWADDIGERLLEEAPYEDGADGADGVDGTDGESGTAGS